MFNFLKTLDCGTKFRKCLKVEKNKKFTPFLVPNPYGPKKKKVPK